MQAPHSESSHPSLAPVRPTCSRTARRSVVLGSTSSGYATPLTVRVSGTLIRLRAGSGWRGRGTRRRRGARTLPPPPGGPTPPPSPPRPGGRLTGACEEVGDRNRPLAALRLQGHDGAEAHQRPADFHRGRGVHQVPADCALGPGRV